MDFLPKHNYRIYQKIEQSWFLVKFSTEDQDAESQIWSYGLTHKKIIWNFFKLTGGTTGYYLVDIGVKKFYYCGSTLQFVKVKLEDLNGLIVANTFQSDRPREVLVSEQSINPVEEIGECYLIYEMTHINRFRPYQAAQFASPAHLQDFAISKRELYQRFLDINGGMQGFYVYAPKSDEALYFADITELQSARDSRQ